MLSQAEWRNDSRVIREAESLREVGYEVHVVARSPAESQPSLAEQNGVTYHSVPHENNEPPSDVYRLAVADFRVRLVAARRVLAGPRRAEAARAALEVAGIVCAAAVLISGLRVASRWPRLRASIDVRWESSRFRERVLRKLQPLRYLNDYAYRTASVVRSLSADVVHAHDLITLSSAITIGKRHGAAVIYDAHELETHTNYHDLSDTTKAWIARYEATLVHECSAVVTVCDSIADWLEREYRIARPIVVMNAPALVDEQQQQDIRVVLGLPAGTPLAVYVGSVTIDRGIEMTIEALAHLPDLHFATVGWRYSETERAILETAARHGVSDRVHLVDPVTSDEVVRFIRSADLSVIPIQNVCLSYYFCFPNKLLESIFAGLPVAVARLVELERFVDRHGVGVIMDETDPKSIAAAIADVLSRREELKPDSEKIREIQRIYGWPTQEARLRKVYRDVVPGRRNDVLTPASSAQVTGAAAMNETAIPR
jgi:glycosyltransferase involved in cell wall biosynthesis